MRRDRAGRVADELMKIIAKILREEVKDPRIPAMTSVVDVKVSGDLSVATIYLSAMTDDEGKAGFEAAIKSASGFIRKTASERLNLRTAPEMRFVLDDSIERGMRLMDLIDKTIQQDGTRDE